MVSNVRLLIKIERSVENISNLRVYFTHDAISSVYLSLISQVDNIVKVINSSRMKLIVRAKFKGVFSTSHNLLSQLTSQNSLTTYKK